MNSAIHDTETGLIELGGVAATLQLVAFGFDDGECAPDGTADALLMLARTIRDACEAIRADL